MPGSSSQQEQQLELTSHVALETNLPMAMTDEDEVIGAGKTQGLSGHRDAVVGENEAPQLEVKEGKSMGKVGP